MNDYIGAENMTGEAMKVRHIGRTYTDESEIWFALSGAGIEFECTAKKCAIAFLGDNIVDEGNEENFARIAIYCNGERVKDFLLDAKEKTIEVFSGEEVCVCVIRVIKLSEAAMSAAGIKSIDTDGTVCPTAEKTRKIEFIGDSITCGYGVDDENELHNFKTATEDVTRAYAYKTAQLLGFEYSMVSYSGYGIISGYTGEGVRQPLQTIPQYYEKTAFSYGGFGAGVTAQSIEWNFQRFVPDIVVINLGTNDDSFCMELAERQNEFMEQYALFLETVRRNNKNAKILCTLGIMGERLCPFVEKAVALFMEKTGDKNISTMMCSDQLPSDGYTANFHPTEKTHSKAAAKLTEKIRTMF